MQKLAVFDFDSTLMDGETIDFLAKELGFEEEVAKITKEAMEGKLDFFNALKSRVALLKGLKEEKVDEVCSNLPLINGAYETIEGLKRRGFKIVCLSGGFRNATKIASKKLGIDADFSNFLHSNNGVLTGTVGGEMMYGDAKGDMIERLQNLLEIDKKNTVVIGDGANDLSMFAYANCKIAFCAKPILREKASHTIDKKDLKEVLKIVDEVFSK